MNGSDRRPAARLAQGSVGIGWGHATPAVFRLQREETPIREADGAPLLRVPPLPRRLPRAGYRVASLPDSL